MAASFLHGAEVFEYNNGPAPITVIKSSVVGLVGSAPLFAASGALQLWDPSWLVALGQQCIDGNGNVQQVTTAGTTGATTTPTWATNLNATTTDGSVTWTLVKLGPIANLQASVLVTGGNANSAGTGQAGMFGPMIQGYSIPYALQNIFAQAAGQVIVVNVFDQTKHSTVVASTAMSFPGSGNQVLNLGRMGISNFKLTNSGGTTTYVQGTDFTLDHVNGIVTAKSGGTLTVGEAVKVSYSYADPSKVADADLVGAVSSGVYSGMQNWLLSYQLFGFFPKILIAPAWGAAAGGMQSVGSNDAVVASGLETIAATMRAVCIIDSPPSTATSAAITSRGTTGNAFDIASTRTILAFPNQQFTDIGIVPTGITVSPAGTAVQTPANQTRVMPYSSWLAGVIVATDYNFGYWYSPSNKPIIGTLGPDISLYSSILDPLSDTNQLNSNGIVTEFSSYGTGQRTWGNRSSAYPTYTTPDVFISVRRTMDVIEESIELSMLQFIDQPINNALISAILASVNAFIRSLIQRGALVAGAASYNPVENPSNQIANGQLVFDIDVMPPPPAERLTFNVYIDTTLLSQLTGNTNGLSPIASATA